VGKGTAVPKEEKRNGGRGKGNAAEGERPGAGAVRRPGQKPVQKHIVGLKAPGKDEGERRGILGGTENVVAGGTTKKASVSDKRGDKKPHGGKVSTKGTHNQGREK